MELIVFQVLLECYNILDLIQGLRLPLLLVSVQDSLKTQEDPMKWPWKELANTLSVPWKMVWFWLQIQCWILIVLLMLISLDCGHMKRNWILLV